MSSIHGSVKSVYLFLLTFAMKLKDDSYKNDWNIIAFCGQRKMTTYLNLFHKDLSHYVSFPLFGFTLVMKLRNFEFENHLNTLLFYKKNWCQIWAYPVKKVINNLECISTLWKLLYLKGYKWLLSES